MLLDRGRLQPTNPSSTAQQSVQPPGRLAPVAGAVALALAALTVCADLAWLAWHRLPLCTADTIAFKQPACMFLYTGRFSIPTYAASPHAELVTSSYSPVYIVANYLAFRTFGFGLGVSLTLDMAIHAALVLSSAWLVWRATHNPWLAVILLLGTMFLLLPVGRPEELAALLVVAALVALSARPKRYAVAVVLLGLVGATSPGAALIGTALLMLCDLLSASAVRRWAVRWAVMLPAAAGLAAALWYAFVHPYAAQAIEQFSQSPSGRFHTATLRELLAFAPIEMAFFSLSVATVTAAALALRVFAAPAAAAPPGSPSSTFVAALVISGPLGLVLNLASGRLWYDYRLLALLYFAALLLLAGMLLQRLPRPAARAAVYVSLTLLALLPQRDMVRYSLAPWLWDRDAVGYEQSVAEIQARVPPQASLGGDGALWAVLNDGRPFYATRWLGPAGPWPDYVVSTVWANPPYMLQSDKWAARLAAEYDRIDVWPPVVPGSCALDIAGWKLPLARGGCDWRFLLWRRHADQSGGGLGPGDSQARPDFRP